MPGADGPLGISGVQQRRLKLDENCILSTISMNHAAPAPPEITNASVGE